MLEPLISSRIRRTLFEHLAKHPTERFYLRGLAKALELPITPLRRELKRLEAAGMLRGEGEGNIIFYTVNQQAAAFQQLQQAMAAPAPTAGASAAAPRAEAEAAIAVTAAMPFASARRASRVAPAAAVGLLVMGLSAAALAYFAVARPRLAARIAAAPSAAGTMRGGHWQIVPGGFGGFSAGGAGREAP